jgi:adenylate kinase family enzyme
MRPMLSSWRCSTPRQTRADPSTQTAISVKHPADRGSPAARYECRIGHYVRVLNLTLPVDVSRVMVTGNAGSGKTTLASSLAESLDLPCHCLDALVWRERWQKAPERERDEQIATLVAADKWLIDGVDDHVMQAAEVVVFLDVPRWVSACRVARRNVRYLFKSRPGLPPRCPEVLVIPKLARLIWRFPSHVRPKILREQERRADDMFVQVVWPQHARSLLDHRRT